MKTTDIDLETDFSHYDEPERGWCETLQDKMRDLLPTKEWRDDNALWIAAADALGNADQRYCRIYACETCGRLYHADYSNSSDPNHDYCGGDTCQPERSHRKYDGQG